MQLILGNKNYSSWSLRPWLLLRYYELNFDEYHIGLKTAQTRDQLAQHCPNRKVPVLVDSDFKVWDSLAICEYVNEKYLANRAWPNTLIKRAQARAMCAEMHSGFAAIRSELPMNCRRPIAAIAMSEQAHDEIKRIHGLFVQCLEDSTENGFLFGDFSIADAYFMPIVVRFTTYAVEAPDIVAAYYKRMLALPAYQQWLVQAQAESAIIEAVEI